MHFSNTSIELSKKNLNRFTYILVPPKGDELAQLCQAGFEDGLRFLQRNNLISCNRCVSIQSSFIIQESLPEIAEDGYDPECQDCTAHRKTASKANLPETVAYVLQQAMESNKGVFSWLLRCRLVENLKSFLPMVLANKDDKDSHRGLAGSVVR